MGKNKKGKQTDNDSSIHSHPSNERLSSGSMKVEIIDDDEQDHNQKSSSVVVQQPSKRVDNLSNVQRDSPVLDKTKIALVMMVKNEKLRLEVSFDSVKNFADTFIILDTGSTDNTIEICKNYCERNNIRLFLKEEPFVNFEVSRNVSLDFADEVLTNPKNRQKEERYLLFLDCNDELRNGEALIQFINDYKGKATGFFLKQQWLTHNKIDSYFNIRMAKAHRGWRYKGIVHEYIHTKIREYDVKERLDHIVLFQDRTKDDDKSMKRFKRDKDMLFGEHLKNPTDSRTIFYLAQTCGCLNLANEAYQYYLKRIKFEGYIEEIFHSYLRLGELAMVLQHPWEESQSWFIKAYTHSSRAEPLVHLTRRYMELNTRNEKKPDYILAYMYASMACKLAYPIDQVLFVDKKVYNYDRWKVLGHCAFHVQQYKEGKDAIIRALMYEESDEDYQMLSQYLKMDKEIHTYIQQNGVPGFKSLTYIVHEVATFIPLMEATTVETKTSKQDVLKKGLNLVIKKDSNLPKK